MKKIILSAIMLTGMLTFAQEEQNGKLVVSGSVDVYGQGGADGGTVAPTSFANDRGFGVGMVNTVFAYQTEKAGVVADLVYGPRGEEATFGADAATSTRIINQAYAYYNLNDKLTFTLGRFNTYYGYEVISPVGNANYSTSYLFSSGPFSHTGLKVDYAVTEDFSIMAAVMNPTDAFNNNADIDNNDFIYGLQLGYLGQYLNFEYGDQDGDGGDGNTFRVDYTGGFDINETFSVGINGAYNTTKKAGFDTGFYGGALYLTGALSEDLSLTLRPEFFTEFVGADNKAEVTAITLSATKSLTSNLSVIAEVRYDNSDAGNLLVNDEYANALVAAVYSF